MEKKELSRKDFLRLAAIGAVTAVGGGIIAEKAVAMESLIEGSFSEEPVIGQKGYERRVARLFKDNGLPERGTSI